MISAMMEITTRIGCILNCRFCPQELLLRSYMKRADAPFNMTMDTFKKCVDKIPDNIDIHFSGMCEPWLNPQCTQMVKYAYDKGHKIYIFTTLVGMKKSDYDELRRMHVEHFVLHIPDRENNSKYTLDEDYLELFNYVLSDVKKGFFRVDSFSCHGRVHPIIEALIGDTGIPVNSNMFDRAGNVEAECNIITNRIETGRIICRWCGGNSLDKNVLLPNGEVVLCCMDYGLEYPLGNLLEQSFEYITDGPLKTQYRMLLESAKNGDILCRKCHRAFRFDEMK